MHDCGASRATNSNGAEGGTGLIGDITGYLGINREKRLVSNGTRRTLVLFSYLLQTLGHQFCTALLILADFAADVVASALGNFII